MRTWMWYVTAVWMVWYCDDVPALTTFDGCGRVEAVVSVSYAQLLSGWPTIDLQVYWQTSRSTS